MYFDFEIKTSDFCMLPIQHVELLYKNLKSHNFLKYCSILNKVVVSAGFLRNIT